MWVNKKFKKIILLVVMGYGLSVMGLFAQEVIQYEDKGRRDPFIALVTSDGRLLNLEPREEKTSVVLEGIIFDNYGNSCAIINDEVLRVGDYIAGFAVYKIEENKVILLKEGKPIEVILRKEE